MQISQTPVIKGTLYSILFLFLFLRHLSQCQKASSIEYTGNFLAVRKMLRCARPGQIYRITAKRRNKVVDKRVGVSIDY